MTVMTDVLAVTTAGALVGLAVAVPLGPIGLLVVDRGRRDLRLGLAAGGGVAAADLSWAVVAATVGARVAGHSVLRFGRTAAGGLLVVVGVVLVARGVRVLTGRATMGRVASVAGGGPARWFATTYLLTLPNPLTVAVFVAAAVEGGVRRDPVAVIAFAAAVATASLAWHVLLAVAGRTLVRRADERGSAVVTIVVGAALALWPLVS
ncbi:LysE family transporter [Egicoccus sp. AB-alg2]|uniref:LysE family transporter n=1 Tax=Egicoccus sp. AB-alg2 TaxID=3242693 RepID=UPI00359E78C3